MKDTKAVHLKVWLLCFCNTAAAAFQFYTFRMRWGRNSYGSPSIQALTLTRNINCQRKIQLKVCKSSERHVIINTALLLGLFIALIKWSLHFIPAPFSLCSSLLFNFQLRTSLDKYLEKIQDIYHVTALTGRYASFD